MQTFAAKAKAERPKVGGCACGKNTDKKS